MSERFAVVMAGGSGSRLWPLSRDAMPKQFIAVEGDKSMLAMSLERLLGVAGAERCFVVTNKNLIDPTREVIRGLIPQENIIAEPSRKDTAACIAYTAMYLREKYGAGVLACVPADGYAKNTAGYVSALSRGLETCVQNHCMVLVGLRPTYPATGYGYMHIVPNLPESKVDEFIEKPEKSKAEQMIATGEWLWNSGIFIGELDRFIAGVREHLPEYFMNIGGALKRLGQPDYNIVLELAYERLEGTSFDRGVLEKMTLDGFVCAVQGMFDWDDIGSLDALAKIVGEEGSDNFIWGDHCGLDTSGCAIYGRDGVLAATIGLTGMIVAVTKDAVLVMPREKAQEVKKLVELLKEKGFEKYV